MTIVADTNVLVSALTGDDERQSSVAQAHLASADMIAVAIPEPPAAEAGLALLEAGGDFADGVIAYEGSWLGRP